MSLSLEGKTALVTGGSRGIGRSIALTLADYGVDVAITFRSSTDAANEVKEEIEAKGQKAKAIQADAVKLGSAEEVIAEITEDWDKLDILVNNAGMGYTCPLADIPLQDWQHVFNLNVTSAFQCIQALLPQMRQAGKGTIINVVSIAGHNAFPGWSAYCASKFAMLGMSRSLAGEERANGIRVTAMCPGAVKTPLWDAPTVHADFNRDNMLDPETVADTILQAVQLPQDAVVEEMTLMSNAGVL